MSMGEMAEDCNYWTNDYEDKLLTRLRAVNVLLFLSFLELIACCVFIETVVMIYLGWND